MTIDISLEKMEEFYNFLMGKEIPEGMRIPKHCQPKLTPKKAFTIIWFLQEHFRILPDNIEQCDVCRDLFDRNKSGTYDEKKQKNYCEFCRTD